MQKTNNNEEKEKLNTYIEQIKEVESIVEKNGFVNLYLHGQIFVDSSFEIIIGKIVKMYCEL